MRTWTRDTVSSVRRTSAVGAAPDDEYGAIEARLEPRVGTRGDLEARGARAEDVALRVVERVGEIDRP